MKKFKKIYLEITNQCNLSCNFCHKTLRPRAFIEPDQFEKTLLQIKGYSDYLCLHVLGEPLLHPELPLLLELCEQFGFLVNLTTNGVLLKRSQDFLLAGKALRQINISLHCCETMAPGPKMDNYLTDTLEFSRTAAVMSSLFINFRLWNQNRTYTPDSIRLNQTILAKLQTFFSLPENTPNLLLQNRSTLAPRIFLSIAERFTWPHGETTDQGANGFCRGLRDHIAILVDGTVVPCCLDAEADIPLGNIKHQAFKDILLNPRTTLIINNFSRRKVMEPLCRHCTYRRSFDRAA